MKTCIFQCSALLLLLVCSSFRHPNHVKDDFRPGYYVDSSGKVEGYINFTYDTYEKFDFKEEPTDKKITKHATDCDGFSVDGKTFRVIGRINLKIGIWNVSAEKAFAEVVVEGPLNLYKVYAMVGNANMRAPGGAEVGNYFLEKANSKRYLYAPPGKARFRSEMMDFFQDRMDIAEKVDDRRYNFNNIAEMVKDYNSKPCDTCR